MSAVSEAETVEPVEPDEDAPEQGEQNDDEQADDDEQPAEPVPNEQPETGPPPLSEKELNKALAALDKEAQRHRTRVTEIMGEEALLLQQCPLCEPHLAGWRFGRVPEPDEWNAITAAVFGEAGTDLKEVPYVTMCDECDGFGQVATRSKVPGRQSHQCRVCQGAGYVLRDTPTTTGAPVAAAAVTESAVSAPGEPAPTSDPWGRPLGDPNYGVLPGYER